MELILNCDILIFIMEVVTFIHESQASHYEELKLRYHLAIAFVNPYLLNETSRKIKHFL